LQKPSEIIKEMIKSKSTILIVVLFAMYAMYAMSCTGSIPLSVMVKKANKELQSLPDSTINAELVLQENYLQLNVHDAMDSETLAFASLLKKVAKYAFIEEYSEYLQSDAINSLLSKCAAEDKSLKLVLIASDDPSNTLVISFSPEELEDLTVTVE